MTARRLVRRIAFGAFLAAVLVFALFPLYYAFVTSLTPSGELFRPGLLPARWTVEHYRGILAGPFLRSILNSALVSAAVVALTLGLTLGAAFALARIRFRGRAAVLFGVLAISMFPQIAVLAGMFELVRTFGLFDSLGALVFSYFTLTLPFAAWVLATFMRGIPVELEMSVENRFFEDDLQQYNTLADLPGSDLADEYIMIGAHLDSWHMGGGATDNAAGSVIMMEAICSLT